ncbi:hypothetical protein RchiOBHm_Chr7g0212651 [Rosa chinensis]|uniref:Uncharacterized protein n=1 Tax=Rosa chinensis TaxID=74649 RepID=A0A2P6PAS4_ROSCH|nr:hypothetical protein RchiOBHm_Chr7g0212651 [Rosa chinensis]
MKKTMHEVCSSIFHLLGSLLVSSRISSPLLNAFRFLAHLSLTMTSLLAVHSCQQSRHARQVFDDMSHKHLTRLSTLR